MFFEERILKTKMHEEIEKASETLSKAFYNDPIWSGFIPDDEKRKDMLPLMFEFSLNYAHKNGTIQLTSENIEGVAVWLTEKRADMSFIRIIFSNYFIQMMKKLGKYKKDMKIMQKTMKVLQKERKKIMKGKKYLYLMALGVNPEYQGNGFGGKLLRRLIEESKRLDVPVYLETETEENVIMYEHFGFKTIKEIDFPKFSFHIWQMIRE
jgi:ribosomal protein S18 acetylase RimI-like enzyme